MSIPQLTDERDKYRSHANGLRITLDRVEAEAERDRDLAEHHYEQLREQYDDMRIQRDALLRAMKLIANDDVYPYGQDMHLAYREIKHIARKAIANCEEKT